LALLAAALIALGATPWATATDTQPKAATRRGWFQNPTPGNAWLTDKDAQWIIGIQGGHQAEGDWPDFNGRHWVSTNRSYGYGCACMKLVVDAQSREVQRIVSSAVRPLKACRQDPTLPKPEA
jgi:hypothetical protein